MEATGLRATRPRRAVAATLAAADRPLTPLQVYDDLRRTAPRVGLASVYRTLRMLEELGLAERVHQAEGCQAYLPARPGHRHLALCRSCGKTREFSGDDLGRLISRVSRSIGYRIDGHWLQLEGLCADCRRSRSAR
jgi:Fur family ferric uptake transcriptional regulator